MLKWARIQHFTEARFALLGTLRSQFLVDVFSHVEDARLQFHQQNQDMYRRKNFAAYRYAKKSKLLSIKPKVYHYATQDFRYNITHTHTCKSAGN